MNELGIEPRERRPKQVFNDAQCAEWNLETGFIDPKALYELFSDSQQTATNGYPSSYRFKLESGIHATSDKWSRAFNTYILTRLVKGTTIGWRHGGIPATLNEVCHALNCGQNALDMLLSTKMEERYSDTDDRSSFRVGGDSDVYNKRLAMHRQAPLYGYVYPVVMVEVLIPAGPDDLNDDAASVMVTNAQGMAALSDVYMADGTEVFEALNVPNGMNNIYLMPHLNGSLAMSRLEQWRMPGARIIRTSDTDVMSIDVRSYPDSNLWWNPYTSPIGRRTDHVCVYRQEGDIEANLREVPDPYTIPDDTEGALFLKKLRQRYSDKNYYDFVFGSVCYGDEQSKKDTLTASTDKTWMAVLARKGELVQWDPKQRWQSFTVLPALRFPGTSSSGVSWSNHSVNRLNKLLRPVPEMLAGARYVAHDNFIRTGMPDYCNINVLEVINTMLGTEFSDLAALLSPGFSQCQDSAINLITCLEDKVAIDRDIKTALAFCSRCGLMHTSPEADSLLRSTSIYKN